MLRKIFVLAVVALASVAIAACGGDDDETTAGSDDAASSEDFVAEVTAACDTASAEILASQEEIQGAVLEGEGDLEALIQDELVPIYENLVSDLEAITPPEDQTEQYDQLIANMSESIDILESEGDELFAASRGEQNEVTQRADELEAEADQLATELGVPPTCAEAQSTGATGAEGAEETG